jgi:hypothetical protein
MAGLFDILISLGLESGEFNDEIDKVNAKFAKFGSDAEREANEAGRKAGEAFAQNIGDKIQKALAALGLGKLVHDVIEYGDKVQDLSDRYGIAATTVQRFGNAAEKNGSTLEQVADGFNRLNVASSKALGGNTAYIKAFDELGVSVKDLETLQPDQLMLKIGAGSLNAADLVKVLGINAASLRPTIEGLAHGTIAFGDAISDVDIAQLSAADDAMKTLKQSVTILVGSGLGNFFTNLQTSTAELTGRVMALGEGLGGVGIALSRLAHGDFSGAKKALDDSKVRQGELVQAGQDVAEEIRHPPAKAPRVPGGAGTGGDTDDEGRDLKSGRKGKTSEERAADRQHKEDEHDEEKVAKIERERHLAGLAYAERMLALQKELDDLQTKYVGADSERERNKLKLEYFAIERELQAEQKKHAAEVDRDKREYDAKHKRDEKPSATGPQHHQEAAAHQLTAQEKDEADRRAHGTYADVHGNRQGTAARGLSVTGLSVNEDHTDIGLSKALSGEDWRAQFAQRGPLQTGADWHKQFQQHGISRADQVKDSMKAPDDKSKEKSETHLSDAVKHLENIEKNTKDIGANK